MTDSLLAIRQDIDMVALLPASATDALKNESSAFEWQATDITSTFRSSCWNDQNSTGCLGTEHCSCDHSVIRKSERCSIRKSLTPPGKRNSNSQLSVARFLTLSCLPYEEYVSEFGRLFTDGFDVQDEIAEAVFDIW